MTTLFISDLHLCAERPEVNAAFFHFLQTSAAEADALYILGDLFEAWIGDDDPAPLSQQVIRALRALTDAGTRLYFQHGNRDFAIGKRFARETGATLLKDHTLVTLGDEQVLVLHGDSLCTDDIAYQKFRQRIRNPLVLGIMRRLPLKTRQQIGIKGRQKSMAANSNKSSSIMDVSPATVTALMTEYGVTTMIHGHTHRPHRHDVQLDDGRQGQRIVLGDWGSKGWLVCASDEGLALSSFTID
ncbi:MAG: UDP-2,3-diacylglucosamine diphosphatase [Gammaproteobacteria bacterium]|nr:UDP-2,3-diacylglucosamine diphosphatase [Gammaproteobacteria bacterium]MBQ0840974.1 UDP-2,3-diacylglucosamine diphosphatase [Gammaproteobacteria bacterium]